MPGWAMSKLDVTTQELFLRLGSTSQLRSARADALFRRLRFDRSEQIAEQLSGVPKRLSGAALDDLAEAKPAAKCRDR